MREGLQAVVDDLDFIETAYARKLGRAVEPQGLREGLRRLKQGVRRHDFLAELGRSDEGLAHAQRLSGTVSTHPRAPTVAQLLAVGPTATFVELSHRLLTGQAMSAAQAAAAWQALADGLPRIDWMRRLRSSATARVWISEVEDVHRLDLTAEEWVGTARADLPRLLDCSDEAFVHLAYWSLLGRAADGAGRQLHLRRLRAGGNRLALLRHMASSPEGRARGSALRGLPQSELVSGVRCLRLLRSIGRRLAELWPRRGRGLRSPAKRPPESSLPPGA